MALDAFQHKHWVKLASRLANPSNARQKLLRPNARLSGVSAASEYAINHSSMRGFHRARARCSATVSGRWDGAAVSGRRPRFGPGLCKLVCLFGFIFGLPSNAIRAPVIQRSCQLPSRFRQSFHQPPPGFCCDQIGTVPLILGVHQPVGLGNPRRITECLRRPPA